MFVSHRRLRHRKSFPRARRRWALDSGGFTELSTYGRWQYGPEEYADAATDYSLNIGKMDWASIQDWMCEPQVIQMTGLDVPTHQRKTIASYEKLTRICDEVNWLPVIQGFTLPDYLRCIRYYADAGINLAGFDSVGIGSICRRQGTQEAVDIIRAVADEGINIHGFGLKTKGLERLSDNLVSADSMAWSYGARMLSIKLPGCTAHKCCNNCPIYALKWRKEMLERLN